jgi:hypothetical protein
MKSTNVTVEYFLYIQHSPECLTYKSLILTKTLQGRYFYNLCFSNEETESQKDCHFLEVLDFCELKHLNLFPAEGTGTRFNIFPIHTPHYRRDFELKYCPVRMLPDLFGIFMSWSTNTALPNYAKSDHFKISWNKFIFYWWKYCAHRLRVGSVELSSKTNPLW